MFLPVNSGLKLQFSKVVHSEAVCLVWLCIIGERFVWFIRGGSTWPGTPPDQEHPPQTRLGATIQCVVSSTPPQTRYTPLFKWCCNRVPPLTRYTPFRYTPPGPGTPPRTIGTPPQTIHPPRLIQISFFNSSFFNSNFFKFKLFLIQIFF